MNQSIVERTRYYQEQLRLKRADCHELAAKLAIAEFNCEAFRTAWENVPWGDLQIALSCSMIEEYYCDPGAGKHVAIAEAWLAANAPKGEEA